jgi:GDP-4-dehydro-6-deoxy-D-mannose reductase
VCRGEGVSLADLTRELAARARVPIEIETDPDRVRPADVPYLVGDPGRIAAETGWRATLPIAETLDAVLAEWRDRTTRT